MTMLDPPASCEFGPISATHVECGQRTPNTIGLQQLSPRAQTCMRRWRYNIIEIYISERSARESSSAARESSSTLRIRWIQPSGATSCPAPNRRSASRRVFRSGAAAACRKSSPMRFIDSLRAASLPDPETHNLAVGRIRPTDGLSQRGAVGQNRPGSLPQLRRMSRFCNNWMCLRRAVDFAANATSTVTRKNNNNKSAHNYKFSAPRDLGLVQSSTSTTTAHVKSLLS